jgi:hypothetical protein
MQDVKRSDVHRRRRLHFGQLRWRAAQMLQRRLCRHRLLHGTNVVLSFVVQLVQQFRLLSYSARVVRCARQRARIRPAAPRRAVRRRSVATPASLAGTATRAKRTQPMPLVDARTLAVALPPTTTRIGTTIDEVAEFTGCALCNSHDCFLRSDSAKSAAQTCGSMGCRKTTACQRGDSRPLALRYVCFD